MKLFFCSICFIGMGILSAQDVVNRSGAQIQTCLVTREYITTLHFLEDHKEFKIDRVGARKLADEVSTGCTDAAERFIRAVDVLLKAEIDSVTSISTAKKLAIAGKSQTDAFITIFKGVYLEKLLDQDARTAFRVALSFASDFKGDLDIAAKDFFKIANYCTEGGKEAFPKESCVGVAEKVAKLTARFDRELAPTFINLLEFMMKSESDGKSPAVALFQAFEKAKILIEAGPLVDRNFIEAFNMAISEDELALGRAEAIAFAEKMALRSYQEIKKD